MPVGIACDVNVCCNVDVAWTVEAVGLQRLAQTAAATPSDWYDICPCNLGRSVCASGSFCVVLMLAVGGYCDRSCE